MDVIIELRTGWDTLVIEPASCVITRAVCNESLQHVENYCDAELVYDADAFAFLASHEQMGAAVKQRDGTALFTGIAGADTSWSDEGGPFPVRGLRLSIKDYTSKLDAASGGGIALLNAPLGDVLGRLAQDCGLSIAYGQAPPVILEAFVMPLGGNYLHTLDALCYQYRMSFFLTNTAPSACSISGTPPKRSNRSADPPSSPACASKNRGNSTAA